MPYIVLQGKQLIIEGQCFPFTLDYVAIAEKLKILLTASHSSSHKTAVNEEFLKDFGHSLYQALCPANIKLSAGPIFLNIRERGISQLPWELIYSEGEWLAKTRGLVRIAGQGGVGAKGGSIQGPLKVLVALASPLYKPGAEANQQPALINLRSQEEIFIHGLQGKRFAAAFHIKSHISRSSLSEELTKDYHVLHFVGHGSWGSLSLEDDCGCVDEITSAWLKENLSNSALHLALFNSCYTASCSPENTCAGIAKTLLDAGIPMVAGMQLAITEKAASTFAHTFYRTLAEGKSVGDAITIGRRAISNCPDCLPWEWITPVLFIQPDALCRIYLPFVQPSAASVSSSAKVIKPKAADSSVCVKQEIFVGRRKELVEILKTISFAPYQPERVIVLKGPPGIGKTTLAIQAVNRLLTRIDRVVWLSGRTDSPPRELSRLVVGSDSLINTCDESAFFEQLARQLKLKVRVGENLLALKARILHHLAGDKKMLLIFDSMEAFYNSDVLNTFIKQLPITCCVIITSCHSIYGLKSREFNVPPMSLEETLLLARYNNSQIIEEKTLQQFYHLSEGNPLLARFFLTQLSQWSKFREQLLAGQPDYLFAYFFQGTFQRLTDEERFLLVAVSRFTPKARIDALAYVCRLNNTNESLDKLVAFSLINLDEEAGTVTISQMGRIWLEGLAQNFPLLDHYRYRQTLFMARFVKSQIELLQPQVVAPLIKQVLEENEFVSEEPLLAEALLTDTLAQKQRLHDLLGKQICQKAIQSLEEEEENAKNALIWCAAKPHLPLLRSLLDNLNVYYTLTSRWEELIKIYKLGLQTMHQTGRVATEAILLNNLGVVYCCMGNWPCALRYLQQSITIKKQLGDHYGLIQSYNNLGLVYKSQGRWSDALQIYQTNLSLFHLIKDQKGRAQSYNNLGLIYQSQGNLEKAGDCFHNALRLKEELEDDFGKAQTLNNLGLLAHEQGDWLKAEKLYQESLTIFERLGHPHAGGQTYSNLALLYYDQGNYEKALDYYQHALETFNHLGDIYGTAQIYNNLGLVYKDMGQKEKAISFYHRSLALKKQLGDNHGIAQTYNNLGVINKEAGNRELARDCYRQSIEMKFKIGDRHGLGSSYANMGFLEMDCQNYESALKLLERAANLFIREGNEQSLQQVMRALFVTNVKLQQRKDC